MSKGFQLIRVFSADKTIDSPLLNRLGVQVFRTVVARLMYNIVPAPKNSLIDEKYKELMRDGFSLWPNFLPEKDFLELEKEALSFIRSGNPKIQARIVGSNTFETARLADIGPDNLP